jgi:hypothetical protein
MQAVRTSFRKDLEREDMTEAERRTAVTLGRFGLAARGGVFVVVGWFVVQAAVFRDPHQAKGLGGALGALAQQPAGRALLVALALGLVALALYCFAAVRWMRMPGASPSEKNPPPRTSRGRRPRGASDEGSLPS